MANYDAIIEHDTFKRGNAVILEEVYETPTRELDPDVSDDTGSHASFYPLTCEGDGAKIMAKWALEQERANIMPRNALYQLVQTKGLDAFDTDHPGVLVNAMNGITTAYLQEVEDDANANEDEELATAANMMACKLLEYLAMKLASTVMPVE